MEGGGEGGATGEQIKNLTILLPPHIHPQCVNV